MKINSTYPFLLFTLLSCVESRSQNIDSLFANAPQTVLPLLSRTARLDMLDLFNSRLTARAENVYGGQSTLCEKSHGYLKVQLTDVSTWTMKIVPQSAHDTLLLCVHSVDAQGISSAVSVYHTDWQPAKIKFEMPGYEEFFAPAPTMSVYKQKRIESVLRYAPVCATVSDTAQVLTLSLGLNDFSAEQRSEAEACVRPLHFLLTDGKWVALREKESEPSDKRP